MKDRPQRRTASVKTTETGEIERDEERKGWATEEREAERHTQREREKEVETRGTTRKDGWTRMEKVLYGEYGRGEASFYRGRHLPTDRHYRAK